MATKITHKTNIRFNGYELIRLTFSTGKGKRKKIKTTVFQLRSGHTEDDELVSFWVENKRFIVQGSHGYWIYKRPFKIDDYKESGNSVEEWLENLTTDFSINGLEKSPKIKGENNFIYTIEYLTLNRDADKNALRWIDELKYYVSNRKDFDDEVTYEIDGFYSNQTPVKFKKYIDLKSIGFKKIHVYHLFATMDFFNEVCRRMKEEPEKIVNFNYSTDSCYLIKTKK